MESPSSTSSTEASPHILVFPFPAYGHMLPIVAAAIALAEHHDLHVTLVLTRPSAPLISLPSHLSARLRLRTLPVDHPPTSEPEALTAASETWHVPLTAIIKDLMKPSEEESHHHNLDGTSTTTAWPPLCALATDTMLAWTTDVAKAVGLPRYALQTEPAGCISLMLVLKHYIHLPDGIPPSIKVPGLGLLERKDYLAHLLDMSLPISKFAVRNALRIEEADGLLINTFVALEGQTVEAIRELVPEGTPVFSIGPLMSYRDLCGPEEEVPLKVPDGTGCLDFLDRFTPRSVLYISFGSLAILSLPQITELALALMELEDVPFIWALRPPPKDELVDGQPSDYDLLDVLPSGFHTSVGQRGIVVPFTPQLKILTHSATGLFLSHCGWGGVMEAIAGGVPVLAWPCFAEQRMNAKFLADQGAALRFPGLDEEGGLVSKEEVKDRVTEGFHRRSLTAKVQQWQSEARKAVIKGGTSWNDCQSFVEHIKLRISSRQGQCA